MAHSANSVTCIVNFPAEDHQTAGWPPGEGLPPGLALFFVVYHVNPDPPLDEKVHRNEDQNKRRLQLVHRHVEGHVPAPRMAKA